MDVLTRRYSENLSGVLSCYDRIVIIGTVARRVLRRRHDEFPALASASVRTRSRLPPVQTFDRFRRGCAALSVAAQDVPRRWWLKRSLDEDSFAYDLMNDGKPRNHLGKQPADAWFDNDDAGKYEVFEQCVQSTAGNILVLLYLADEEMLFAGFDPGVGNRKYNEHGSHVPRRVRRY